MIRRGVRLALWAFGLGLLGMADAETDPHKHPRSSTKTDPQARLVVRRDSAATSLGFQAASNGPVVPLHRTTSRVVSPELHPVDAAGLLYASWDEVDADGVRHLVSVSKDGGARWSRSQALTFEIPLRAGRLVPGSVEPALPPGLRAARGSRLYILQYRTMGLAAWRDRLAALGVEVLRYLPEHAQIVRMPEELAERVRRESFVAWVGPFHPGYRVDPALAREISERGKAAGRETRRYLLQTFSPGAEEKRVLAEEVRRAGGTVAQASPNGYLLVADLTLDQAALLARSEHLLWIQLAGTPGSDSDILRSHAGANYVESVGGYSGTGVRGEVLDDGIMKAPVHQDHDGVLFHGPTPDSADHGTATYGIVFGNGARDGDGTAMATGLLPSAQGWFADWSKMTDRYQHTADLIQSPIFASFQSNSWGNTRTTAYDSYSFQMDDIIWLDDLPIFQVMSNDESRSSRPEAWAKNIIAVGGINHFNTESLADDCWVCPGVTRGGASIGPADDGRIKPDLSYWFDMIFTTDREPGGWITGSLYYDDFHGTSAAAPSCAGIAGLILEMWADNVFGTNPVGSTVFEKRPHSSTTKALLINTAVQYPFSGKNHDLTRTHQGWGLPNAQRAYDRAPLMKIVDETSVLTELETDRYTATVPGGQGELKVTLVYADRAGTTTSTLHRINDVTLKVTAPDSTVYWGNVGLDVGNWSSPGGGPDTKNTVENVFIQNPAAGAWTVEISADEINQDVHAETTLVDQDYALVVYGVTDLVSCRATTPVPTGLQVVPQGSNTVELTWTGTPSATGYRVYRSQAGCQGQFELVGTVGAPDVTYADTTASGGVTYSYQVRALEACESMPSECVQAITTGPCTLPPAFAGLAAATSAGAGSCAVSLSWPAASPQCGGPVRYNVYRSTSPTFTPSAANRVAGCVATLAHTDTVALTGGQTYHYLVRAEDIGGRPDGACGGIEETNGVLAAARPFGAATVLLSNSFDTGLQSWVPSKGSPAATTGDFIAGDPVGTINGPNQVQPELDHTPTGTQCLYTAANSTAAISSNDVDNGEVIVTSPAFNATGFAGARFQVWRWHYIDAIDEDLGDYFALDASANGGSSWTNLETLGNLVRENSWVERVFYLDAVLALTGNMKVRARSADGLAKSNIIESAIDDVKVEGLAACAATGPDGDADNYSAPVDCNDADAAVNPAQAEIVYNGKDDDCVPATPDDDLDLDGLPLALDCDDANAQVWATPAGEAQNLTLSHDETLGITTLSWNPPADFGGLSVVYDLLVATNPSDFTSTTCLESDDGPNTAAQDSAVPALDAVLFYAVRADNACAGHGSIGNDSDGQPRAGRACP